MRRAVDKLDTAPTGVMVGYARVSTDDQSLDLQVDALRRAGVHSQHIHVEKVSGVARKRPGLSLALRDCRAGDTLVVWKLDRVGRSLLHLLGVLDDLERRGVGFKSITEGIDTTTAGGRLIMHVMGALAQFERDLIRERTRAGIAARRERGSRFGAEPKIDMAKAARMFALGKTAQDVADAFGCHRSAVYHRFSASAREQLRDEYLAAKRKK